MIFAMARSKVAGVPKETARKRSSLGSFKGKVSIKRSRADRVADFLTESFGTIFFLVSNALLFMVWIVWNLGFIPGVPIFDPLPFGFLTMIVSLEAILLAIVVLISQNREAKIAELREEVDLYINTYAEREITKLIYLQTLLLKKHGISIAKDADIDQMLKNLKSDEIEQELEKQLGTF